MTTQESSLVQALLEGVSLPASKSELIDYARRQEGGGHAAGMLERIPEREYKSLDEVGEALAPVQPDRAQPQAQVPEPESGGPPGGEAYTDPSAEPGSIRSS